MLYSIYIKLVYIDRKQISGCLGRGHRVAKGNYKGAQENGVMGMFDFNGGNGFMDVYMSNVSNCIL